jgi:hypothetical protein
MGHFITNNAVVLHLAILSRMRIDCTLPTSSIFFWFCCWSLGCRRLHKLRRNRTTLNLTRMNKLLCLLLSRFLLTLLPLVLVDIRPNSEHSLLLNMHVLKRSYRAGVGRTVEVPAWPAEPTLIAAERRSAAVFFSRKWALYYLRNKLGLCITKMHTAAQYKTTMVFEEKNKVHRKQKD